MYTYLAGWAVEARAFEREQQARTRATLDAGQHECTGRAPVEISPEHAGELPGRRPSSGAVRSRHLRHGLPFFALIALVLVLGTSALDRRAGSVAGSAQPATGPAADASASGSSTSPAVESESVSIIGPKATPDAAEAPGAGNVRDLVASPRPLRRDPCPYRAAPRAVFDAQQFHLAGYVLPCPPFGMRRVGSAAAWA